MTPPQRLLERLEAIGRSLQASGHTLALIGLGSVGLERDRLDEHSDLDFFALVEPGQKARYLQDLSWLSDVAPVVFLFPNTADGYKLLYADGIFCEFAVFEPQELEQIPFAAGQVVWSRAGVDASVATPTRRAMGVARPGMEWNLGEALTNLYVGLKRYRRGEKLSAMRFVQGFALDRVLELASVLETEQPARRDPFNNERRLEQRFPRFSARLPELAQGYERTPESALAQLAFLEQHFEVNAAMAREIRALAALR
ncbi:hypothetical protein [Allomeiothermus silvanus]|uniref:hypothetical protein n=1 Tax=Allomeiothermus silvanus TaxID=52022 RepID=UPI0023F463E4|nr:hypothetical protein [Allomeiothermus silvanus]